MGRKTAANDWEYAGIISAGASIGLAGGGWVFSFRSKTADVWEDWVMLAAGVAVPGLSVEVSLPDFASDDLSWSKIKSAKGFAAIDLDGARATFTTEGVSAAFAGYSSLFLSASNTWGAPLFTSQENSGYSVGVEIKPVLSAGAMAGIMYGIGSTVRKVVVPVVNWSCWSLGAGSGLLMAGDALITGRGQSVLFAFAEGYAWMLAELTEGKLNMSVSDAEWYLGLKWEAAVIAAGNTVKQYGSKSPSGTFDDARDAGKACILQTADFLIKSRGRDYWDELCASERGWLGKHKDTRRDSYENSLRNQIKKGATASQIGISLTL